MNAQSIFTGNTTKKAFKESGIKATDSPAHVWDLPAENCCTASDLELCAIVSGVKESCFNHTFQSAGRDKRRKSNSKGKRFFVFLCNPIADHPAYLAERCVESAIQASESNRELVKRTELISRKPTH